MKEIHQGSMDLVDGVSATTYRVFTRRPEIGVKEEVVQAGQKDFRAMPRAEFLSSRTLFVTWRRGRIRSRMLYAQSSFQ